MDLRNTDTTNRTHIDCSFKWGNPQRRLDLGCQTAGIDGWNRAAASPLSVKLRGCYGAENPCGAEWRTRESARWRSTGSQDSFKQVDGVDLLPNRDERARPGWGTYAIPP